jgi:ABC-2 type transport system permease protein
MILGLALCAFSTAWGCVCGVKHMRLDWENEVEVIKQGAAVTIYLLPNMFAAMGMTVLMVILGTRMDHRLLTLVMTAIASVLALLSYLRVMSLSKR